MTVPAGSVSLAQDTLRRSLAACPSVQAWLAAADAAAALARIYHEGLPAPLPTAVDGVFTREELIALRPAIVIYTAERAGFGADLEACGETYQYRQHGLLVVRLYQNAPAACGDEPTSDANLQFKNTVGQVIDDLCSLSGQAGYLLFSKILLSAGPYWNHPKAAAAQGVWQGAELQLEWQGL